MNSNASLSQELVTTVISHRVKPGRAGGYEEWLKGIAAAARTFEGYLGVSIFRPQAGGPLDYVLVLQFNACERLLAWLHSDIRREWIERAEPLLLEPEKIQTLTGLEAWFELPASLRLPSGPKRYKQALLVWIAVMLVSPVLRLLLGPFLGTLPAIIALALQSAISVACLTYVVMPRLTQLFKRWLYPS